VGDFGDNVEVGKHKSCAFAYYFFILFLTIFVTY